MRFIFSVEEKTRGGFSSTKRTANKQTKWKWMCGVQWKKKHTEEMLSLTTVRFLFTFCTHEGKKERHENRKCITFCVFWSMHAVIFFLYIFLFSWWMFSTDLPTWKRIRRIKPHKYFFEHIFFPLHILKKSKRGKKWKSWFILRAFSLAL